MITTQSVANATLRAKIYFAYFVLALFAIPSSYLFYFFGKENAAIGVWWIIKEPFLNQYKQGVIANARAYVAHSNLPVKFDGELTYYAYKSEFWNGFGLWTIGSFILIFAGWYGLSRIANKAPSSKDKHVRGARLATVAELNKELKSDPNMRQSRFQIGGVNIPYNKEPRSFMCAGAPGSGKSQTMFAMCDKIVANSNDRMIFADLKSEFLERYMFSPRTINGKQAKYMGYLLNPFDSRDAGWSPFAEIEHISDVEAIALSIIPAGTGGESDQWNAKARTVLVAVMERLHLAGRGTNGELCNMLLVSPVQELYKFLEGHPAASNCSPFTDQPWGSIKGILGTYLSPFRHLDPSIGSNGFSLKKYVAGKYDRNGVKVALHITYTKASRDALRELIAAQIDVLSTAILSQPIDHVSADRTWVFVDEMPLLGKINSIIELATNGRKYGGCLFVGLQDLAQFEKTYGKLDARTLLSCLQTWIIFQVSEKESAKYMSDYIGSAEVEHESTSESSSDQTVSKQEKQKQLVLPSEVSNLRDLEAYIRIPGFPVVKTKMPIVPKVKPLLAGFVKAEPKSATPVLAQETKAETKVEAQAESKVTAEAQADTPAQAEPSIQEQARAIRAALANPGKRKVETAPAPAAAAVVEAVEIPELPADMPADIPLDMPDDIPLDMPDDLPADLDDPGDPGDLDGDLPL